MAWHRNSDPKASAGHFIAETGAGLKNLPDCPVCKYGTMMPDEDGKTYCIDCKAKRLEDARRRECDG